MGGFTWTKEDTQFLKDNYINMTDKELAKKLNRTETAVLVRRYKLNLTRDRHNKYRLYSGSELLAQGTVFEIAEQTGVQVETVYQYNTPTYRSRAPQGKRLVKIN